MRLEFSAFDAANALDGGNTAQTKYLRGYLTDLGAKAVVTEKQYFDRDYLSEFAAFYGVSARAYPNFCRRMHFFADAAVDAPLFQRALDGEKRARNRIVRSYLGFIVIRPIETTPFGRSVLKMYPSTETRPVRCMAPARKYKPHVAGLELAIDGVAWQQQDGAVSSCASVALWTMFQASAFDEHHAIPTTTTVTRLANEAVLSRGRVFPSDGLNTWQLSRAIRAAGLEPMIADPRDSATVMSSIIASLVRSGFPVLVAGQNRLADGTTAGDGHAVCVVGFRETSVAKPSPETIIPQDEYLQALYVHDDNLGPNVRFEILDKQGDKPLRLKTAPPQMAAKRGSVTRKHPPLPVDLIVAAVPEGLRLSVTALHRHGARVGRILLDRMNQLLAEQGHAKVGFTFTARFARIAEYLADVLPTAVAPSARGRARMSFVEQVPPTSLFVGVVRVGTPGTPLIDLVFDTSDSDHHVRAWATVAFEPRAHEIIAGLIGRGMTDFGTLVDST